MAKLSEKIQAELENISKVLGEINKIKDKKKKSTAELAGLATFLHNFYSGIENILNQILKEKNITIAKSDAWHKDLLKVSFENNIISEELKIKLTTYLGFRHFFVHAYGFMLRENDIKNLTEKTEEVLKAFTTSISKYYA